MEVFNTAVHPIENKFNLHLVVLVSFFFFFLHFTDLDTGTKCDHIRNISKISDFFVAKRKKKPALVMEIKHFWR